MAGWSGLTREVQLEVMTRESAAMKASEMKGWPWQGLGVGLPEPRTAAWEPPTFRKELCGDGTATGLHGRVASKGAGAGPSRVCAGGLA